MSRGFYKGSHASPRWLALAAMMLSMVGTLPAAGQPVNENAKLLPGDGAAGDWFGSSVAISGTTAVVGAWLNDDNGSDSGSAYVFDTTTGQQIAKLLPSDGAAGDEFGHSVAISGTTAVVGAWRDDDNGSASGSAYLFNLVPPCVADVNGDGQVTPTDFTAWINTFNNSLPECDQNGDGSCTPTDFTAWIANYNAGC